MKSHEQHYRPCSGPCSQCLLSASSRRSPVSDNVAAARSAITFLPARRFSLELPREPFSGCRTKRGGIAFTTDASIPVAILAGTDIGTVFLRTPSSSVRPTTTVLATATTDPGIGTTATVLAMAATDQGIGTTTVLDMVNRVPGISATLVGMLPGK